MTGAKATYPVRPGDAIVANFKHIQVEPDFLTRSGVPLYKLSALDSMIEALSHAGSPSRDTRVKDASSVDTMLANMSRELRSRAANPFMAGSAAGTGLVVDLAA
jgi:hypothetical protein